MPTHYFLGTRLLGSSPRAAMWADSTPQVASTAFMCEHCGEVWGRVILSEQARWAFQLRNCRKHDGGSFIAGWRTGFEELPPEVIKYEFDLLLSKENEND